MHPLSRRELFTKSATVGAAALAAPALLSSVPASASALPAGLKRRAGHGGPAVLDNAAWFEDWEHRMVGLGNRLPGRAALGTWVDLLEDQLQRAGLATFRDTQVMPEPSWNATKRALHIIDGQRRTPVTVASYFPYSGTTPAGGITAVAVNAGQGTAADFAAQDLTGKIAVVSPPFPASYQTYASWFATPGLFAPGEIYLEYDPGHTIAPDGIYRSCFDYKTVVGSIPALALAAGAAGVAIILDAAPQDALGQYNPFGQQLQGIPALYLDRVAGKQLLARVDAAPTTVTLTLAADVAPASVDNLTAILPGSNAGQYVHLLTHLDGIGSAEENGGIALVAMARYLSQLPASSRQRSVIFHFTYHMSPGVSTNGIDLLDFHPDLYNNSVTVFGIEHLGQMNWIDDNATGRFFPTHNSAVAQLATNTNTVLAQLAGQAVQRNHLVRNLVCAQAAGLAHANWTNLPGLGYCPLENNLCSFAGEENLRLGTFNATLMRQQVQAWLTLHELIDATSTAALFSTGGPYVNAPPSP